MASGFKLQNPNVKSACGCGESFTELVHRGMTARDLPSTRVGSRRAGLR